MFANMFNVGIMTVNTITFVKIGRLTFSFCVAKQYRPLPKQPAAFM